MEQQLKSETTTKVLNTLAQVRTAGFTPTQILLGKKQMMDIGTHPISNSGNKLLNTYDQMFIFGVAIKEVAHENYLHVNFSYGSDNCTRSLVK